MPATRKWIVIDSMYLAYRGHYTVGNLTHNGKPTGVIFSFLRDIRTLEDRFNSRDFIFTFDSPGCLRRKKCQWYKANRLKQGNCPVSLNLQENIRNMVHQQANEVRFDVLPALGYQNVFGADGYEGDDVIASVLTRINPTDRAVIISRDKDLYQLLNSRVEQCGMNHTDQPMTEKLFKSFFKGSPKDWPKYKALMGDKSDNITGAKGVGQVYAVKYFSNTLPEHNLAFKQIQSWIKTETYQNNIELCTIPWPGCPKFNVVVHKPPSESQWQKVMDQYGIRSLSHNGNIAQEVRKGVDW